MTLERNDVIVYDYEGKVHVSIKKEGSGRPTRDGSDGVHGRAASTSATIIARTHALKC